MTHKAKVLALLSDGLFHSHMEGYRLGVMLHSRVSDLRKDGYVIECRKDGHNYRYRLLSRPGALRGREAVGNPAGSGTALTTSISREPERASRTLNAHTEEALTPLGQVVGSPIPAQRAEPEGTPDRGRTSAPRPSGVSASALVSGRGNGNPSPLGVSVDVRDTASPLPEPLFVLPKKAAWA